MCRERHKKATSDRKPHFAPLMDCILTSFSVFTVSLKNYISLKLAALPFPIIIGDPPSGSRNVPIFFKPIAAPPPFGLTSLETKLTINP
ncbi:MAG: hypothetical protein ACTS43_02485 [Candidatus Hodgkinia cicadicola]